MSSFTEAADSVATMVATPLLYNCFIYRYELMDSQVQVSLTCQEPLFSYVLGVAICSLAQSKGGRLIERMTGQSREGATAEVRNHLAN